MAVHSLEHQQPDLIGRPKHRDILNEVDFMRARAPSKCRRLAFCEQAEQEKSGEPSHETQATEAAKRGPEHCAGSASNIKQSESAVIRLRLIGTDQDFREVKSQMLCGSFSAVLRTLTPFLGWRKAKTGYYTAKLIQKKSKKGLAIIPAVSKIARKCWCNATATYAYRNRKLKKSRTYEKIDSQHVGPLCPRGRGDDSLCGEH